MERGVIGAGGILQSAWAGTALLLCIATGAGPPATASAALNAESELTSKVGGPALSVLGRFDVDAGTLGGGLDKLMSTAPEPLLSPNSQPDPVLSVPIEPLVRGDSNFCGVFGALLRSIAKAAAGEPGVTPGTADAAASKETLGLAARSGVTGIVD